MTKQDSVWLSYARLVAVRAVDLVIGFHTVSAIVQSSSSECVMW
jgi:hypothetical protein